MKAIHLTAGLALVLLPLASASAANRSAALAGPTVVDVLGGAKGVPGDFNGDGNPDLIFENSVTGELQAWLLTGTEPRARVRVDQTSDDYVVGSDDFNGYSRTDLVFWNSDSGNATIWYLDGTRLISKSEIILGLPDYQPVSVVDYNRDGNPDILFQHLKGGDIFVLLLRGETIIAKQPIDLPQAGADFDWRVLGTGDFDRDGDTDLVLFHSNVFSTRTAGEDIVAVALMDGYAGQITTVTKLSDRNWVIRAVADFSRDGWPDLFFENVATGETGVWEMEGLKIRYGHLVTGPSTYQRGWPLVGPR